jgi:DNA-binding response OmpR family regulator
MPDEPAPVKVLVVSRDRAVLDDAEFGFPAHATVKTARDATEAQAMLEDWHPDVAVVDLQTGNAGGYSLALAMSQIRANKDIPLLMLLEREQDEWLARQAGAALIRTKPVSVETLADETLSLVS